MIFITKILFSNCFSFAARQFTVRLGDIDLERDDEPSTPATYTVKNIRAHPKFSRVGFYNDIAILELSKPVRKTPYITPICIPQVRHKTEQFAGARPTVVGWGTTYYGNRVSILYKSHVSNQFKIINSIVERKRFFCNVHTNQYAFFRRKRKHCATSSSAPSVEKRGLQWSIFPTDYQHVFVCWLQSGWKRCLSGRFWRTADVENRRPLDADWHRFVWQQMWRAWISWSLHQINRICRLDKKQSELNAFKWRTTFGICWLDNFFFLEFWIKCIQLNDDIWFWFETISNLFKLLNDFVKSVSMHWHCD